MQIFEKCVCLSRRTWCHRTLQFSFRQKWQFWTRM